MRIGRTIAANAKPSKDAPQPKKSAMAGFFGERKGRARCG